MDKEPLVGSILIIILIKGDRDFVLVEQWGQASVLLSGGVAGIVIIL